MRRGLAGGKIPEEGAEEDDEEEDGTRAELYEAFLEVVLPES